jgi:hypothetical protein
MYILLIFKVPVLASLKILTNSGSHIRIPPAPLSPQRDWRQIKGGNWEPQLSLCSCRQSISHLLFVTRFKKIISGLEGLSHEIDFKNVDENGQILALLKAAAGF